MRQLFVFETVDGDGHVAEVACLALSEGEAAEMLTAEGYEGSFVGAVALGSEVVAPPQVDPLPEFTFDADAADAPSPGTAARAAAGEDAPPEPDDESGVAAEAVAPLPLSALHGVARDYAMLSVYAIGMDVATVARATGVTPREAARRLAFHLLGTPDEGTRRRDASRMVLEMDDDLSSATDLYLGGMSISEIVDALGHSATDIVWALLDAPARVVAVTPAVLRAVRRDLDVLKDAASR